MFFFLAKPIFASAQLTANKFQSTNFWSLSFLFYFHYNKTLTVFSVNSTEIVNY